MTLDGFRKNYENGVMGICVESIKSAKSMLKDDARILGGLDHLYSVALPMTKLYYGLVLNDSDGIHTKDSVLKKPSKVNTQEGKIFSCDFMENNYALLRRIQVVL